MRALWACNPPTARGRGDAASIRGTLDAGYAVEARDGEERTPFVLATEAGHFAAVLAPVGTGRMPTRIRSPRPSLDWLSSFSDLSLSGIGILPM
ncbi:hypothetical protein OJF2_73700 [Aquisphaera giovannonii]|uniref:Uncharacterized protein n=1 Tax=Aquisphaera giovannonii TaxID=406548 RepID=A0A5B9WEW1_9BACT|nr:hypothetical protein OJF2_73700 [Aquisphaera giovannonii]